MCDHEYLSRTLAAELGITDDEAARAVEDAEYAGLIRRAAEWQEYVETLDEEPKL